MITTSQNKIDHEWAQHTFNLGLHATYNQQNFSRQGGHNYTSTSHINGLYTNLHNHTTFKNNTLINDNQNSDQFPVYVRFHPNNIITKWKSSPTDNPHITSPNQPPKTPNNVLRRKQARNRQPYKHSTPQATHPQQKENA